MTYAPDPKPFAELFNSPEDFEAVFQRIHHIIIGSFSIDYRVTGRKPEITEMEVKRRWQICEKWFRIMRGEVGFGLIETMDTLAKALACELLGQPFDPKKRRDVGWAPHHMSKLAGSDL